ncbi:MAG: 3-dehydroquinate synthase [Alphaproteobacteria bacterium]|nr:3-dehydroquinate synthase [Alphaproteobacteria bacterium]
MASSRTALPHAHDVVPVELGARRYDIVVGEGLIAHAGRHITERLGPRPLAVVTDANVARLHLDALMASLAGAKQMVPPIVVEAGEASKDFAYLERVVERLIEARIERSTLLIALGGGVIGDLAGFAASVALRGIDFVQVPTTLLAQVDSSVGGKTAINSRHGKNLIGSFHQPRLVLSDIGALDSLPGRELRAGYAEVAKYGLIDDAPFFAWLERNAASLLAGDRALRREAVMRSCQSKARIVAADEREADVRALLNLGHTFGHAFEAETGFGSELLHGEAVALGMALAHDLSARLGLCPPDDATRVKNHLKSVGLPSTVGDLRPRDWRTDRLIEHMAHDKKVKDGRLTFILSRGIGRAFITTDVPIDALRALLDDSIAAAARR